MKKILLNKAEPDMILAKSVLNQQGTILCGAGKQLTENLIDRFQRMGIEEIWVEGDEPLSAPKLLKMRKQIEKRFSVAESCPICNDLKQILLERLENRAG